MRKLNELITSEINLLASLRLTSKYNINQFMNAVVLSDAARIIEYVIPNNSLSYLDNVTLTLASTLKLLSSTSQYSYDYDNDFNTYIMIDPNTIMSFKSDDNTFLFVTKYE